MKEGHKTAALFWPGSEAAVQGQGKVTTLTSFRPIAIGRNEVRVDSIQLLEARETQTTIFF